MRCRRINDLLAVVIFVGSAYSLNCKADDLTFEQARAQEYMVIPAKKCADKSSANVDFFCKGNFAPKDLNKRQLQVVDESRALVRFSSSSGSESDDLELLCYRCSFNKIEKKFCGRYQAFWNKPQLAPKCPALD